MVSNMALVALTAPTALLAVSLLACLQRGPRPRMVETASTLASLLGVGTAMVLAVLRIMYGPSQSALLGTGGLGLSLRLDALSVTLFAMVALLALVIMRFSRSYLDGDARQGVFLGRLAATVAAVQVLVLAGNLLLFWIAWVATSLCLHALLVFYPERPRARIAARKKFIVARLGDLALAGAFGLLYIQVGSAELDVLFAAVPQHAGNTSVAGSALLLAIAALLKSAQFPTHGWLVEVMETPTPVSALLHAGILNAGPFLVLRFAAVMDLGQSAALLLIVAGGFTALFASVVLLTQPTVKVALGYSSAAHMGFMLMVCGLGVYPAAVLHLVAHSFYKAHAFLSSGSVVETARAKQVALPPRLRSPLRLMLSWMMALALYLAVALLLGLMPWEQPALLVVGAIVVMGLAQLLAPGLDSRLHISALLHVVTLAVVVTLAFFGLEELTRLLLEGALPEVRPPNSWVIGTACAVLLAFGLTVFVQLLDLQLSSPFMRRLQLHLRNGLYANTLFDRLIGALRF